MEELFTEKYHYATIIPLKDYSVIKRDKPKNNGFYDDFTEYDEDGVLTPITDTYIKRKTKYIVTSLPEKRDKRRIFFFQTTNPVQERFKLEYAYINPLTNNSFDTTNDQQIKRHFGKPFSNISITTTERSIRKHGDKITIKIYHGYKHRHFNGIYFKKNYTVISITINTKTGNFTLLEKSKHGKKTSSRFRTNCFLELNNGLIGNHSFFNVHKCFQKNSRLYNEMINSFDDVKFTTKIQESLFGSEVGFVNYSLNPNQFTLDLIDYFVKVKKIKVPNGNIEYFLSKFYPTEKYLKKNERKLIASILDMIKLKSKYTIKILHQYPNIDLVSLSWLCNKLGDNYSKYLANIDVNIFKNSNRNDSPYSYNGLNKRSILNLEHPNIPLLDNERENLIKILSSDVTNRNLLSEQSCRMYDDHFKMIQKLKPYDPNISMKARTMIEFNAEHRELSRMVSAIRKGWVIEYQFAEKMVKDVEEPIDLKIKLEEDSYGEITFYPHILKREEEYSEEGDFMHHCVASYSDKDKSIIISIRTENEMDRVTCEFDCQTGKLLQARHFCNKQPPADMELAIDKLKTKTAYYARMGILQSIDKRKVPVKINGIEIIPEQREPKRINDFINDLGLRQPQF